MSKHIHECLRDGQPCAMDKKESFCQRSCGNATHLLKWAWYNPHKAEQVVVVKWQVVCKERGLMKSAALRPAEGFVANCQPCALRTASILKCSAARN